LGRVRNGECHVGGAQLRGELCSFAIKPDRRAGAGPAVNFNVAPAHALAPAGAQCLHRCFFGGESSRISFNAVGLGVAITSFGSGEYPSQKTVAKTGDGFADAMNFSNIDSRANYHVATMVIIWAWKSPRLRRGVHGILLNTSARSSPAK